MPPDPQPVRRPARTSLSRRVREDMEQLIRSGSWRVGERIPAEPELMQLFHVGHNTLREAVQGLIHAGMLVARPGDGTYVTAVDRLDAALDHSLQYVEPESVLQARLAIEQAVVELAARNRTAEDLERIRAAWGTCCARAGHGIEDDLAFHAAVADAAHNPLLSRLYRVIAAYLSRQFTTALAERQYDPAALQLHVSLIRALEDRDPAAARQVVERIVEFTDEK